MLWWVLAVAAADPFPKSADAPFPDLPVCDGNAAPTYQEATGFMTNAVAQTLSQVESKHIVAVVPHTAAFATGEAAVSALLYAALPRLAVADGTGYESALSKVVLIGVSESDASEGFWVPPCGELTDPDAAQWLVEAAPKMVNGPAVLAAKPSKALENQVPFVDLVLGERYEGGVLPVVLGSQSPQLAQQMGDLLGQLVGAKGPKQWQTSRVLFVFAADLSRDLEKKWAQPRDAETVQRMVSSGFGALLTYFDELKKVALPGESRRPFDYGGVLAAAKLAENLQLRGSEVRVSSSGDFIGATDRNDNEKVRGYASVLFLNDERSAGERLSAAPKMPTLAPTTTSTTPPPTTVVPPPTMSPAPFGASPPALLEEQTRTVDRTKFRRFLRSLPHLHL